MKCFKLIIFIGIFLCLLCVIKTDSVCDLMTLKVEIKQDLADNGMLDCLRVIEPPHFVQESEEQKNLRLAAQWDTACSFESSSNWFDKLKKYYEISTLVDSIGEPVKEDFEDQADMCEILRAAVSKNTFNLPDLNMQKIPEDIIDKIDCAGRRINKREEPRICAANGGSFFQKDAWIIFLDSSVIKFASTPEFTYSDKQPDPIRNPYLDSTNPQMQNALIKDLMKFSTDQLDKKEGELINMIDQAEQAEGRESKQKNEQEKDSDETTNVHVHVKRIKELTMSAATEKAKYNQIDDGTIKFSVEETKTILGFYMTTVKFDKPADAFMKLSFAGREMPETRQSIGGTEHFTLTGSFSEVYNPKEEEVELQLLYQSSAEGKISTERGEENFSFGVITLPEGHSSKKINSSNMEFHKSDKWNIIPNFNLNVNYTEKKETYFIIMYNMAFPLGGAYTLQTRVRVNSKLIPEMTVNCGPYNLVSINSAFAVKIQPGNTLINIEYKYQGDSVMILEDFVDQHYVQSISAFQLPESTIVKDYVMSKPVTLNTSSEWKGFGFDANITITKKKTVLILYNINLRVDGADFAVRVRFDEKYSKKSVHVSQNKSFVHAQGYVVKVMKKGKYNIDLDFKSNSKNAYSPENSELDGENVSMQIIILS